MDKENPSLQGKHVLTNLHTRGEGSPFGQDVMLRRSLFGGRRSEIVYSDKCAEIDKVVMIAEPLTKIEVARDIDDRLKNLLEKNSLDSTQTHAILLGK